MAVQATSYRLTCAVCAGGCLILLAAAFASREHSADTATRRYVDQLDITRFERRGTSFTDPDLSPHRVGPIHSLHEITYKYDFDRLVAVERRLQGVDRRLALRAVFSRIVDGKFTHHERHLAILRFLHRASFHNLIQPMYPNGIAVFDPLVLLELGEMRCGQVNRVAVDLLRTNGYPARLVQAACHVLAEVWYDGGWHYFDGDIFGNGETVMIDGHIPSFAELSENPAALDSLTAYWEPTFGNGILTTGTIYPSWYYFAAKAYAESGTVPEYIEKRASPSGEATWSDFGWNTYEVIPDPTRRLLEGDQPRRTPPPPQITEVRVVDASQSNRSVSIAWRPALGANGYRVFVSHQSRGWNYDGDSLPRELRRWKSSHAGWKPEMYASRYSLPPSDVALLESREASIELRLSHSNPIYISIMPIDAYGESVGRRLYPLSEELCVR